jgi:hypothetical protein
VGRVLNDNPVSSLLAYLDRSPNGHNPHDPGDEVRVFFVRLLHKQLASFKSTHGE